MSRCSLVQVAPGVCDHVRAGRGPVLIGYDLGRI
jgi:hypothetical protein